jgi:hypothetical protein
VTGIGPAGLALDRLVEKELIAGPEHELGGFTGRKLEDRLRAPLGGGAPWGQIVRHADDAEIAVEPDSVDREAHEECVNRGSGAKKESFAPFEPVTSQESPHTGERCLREEAPFADNLTVLTFQDSGH